MRTLLSCGVPDWPVIAAEIVDGVPATGPVAVLHANRVVACSPAARAEGVRRGLRKREAQGRCPQLVVVEHDPGRDARAFEPVVAAVEELAPGVEVVRPGVLRAGRPRAGPLLRRRGGRRPSGSSSTSPRRARWRRRSGSPTGCSPPMLAARAGRIVAAGRHRRVPRPAWTSVARPARRWPTCCAGWACSTLGEFAALPAGDVLARFGFDAALAHRLAAGRRRAAARRPPAAARPDVTEEFDEPVERVDVAAFAARALAERLHERLAGHGLACTRLGIEAHTAHGEELHRVWRHDGLLTAAAIADRVRWQLDGWLTGTGRRVPARRRPGRPPASSGCG